MKAIDNLLKIICLIFIGIFVGMGGGYLYYQQVIRPRNASKIEQAINKNRNQYDRQLTKQRAEYQMALNHLEASFTPTKAGDVDHLPTKQKNQIDATLNQNHFTGTVLFYKNGKTVYQRGYGYADFQTKRLNNYAALYQWASVQKSVTAVLIMKQVKTGKLQLSDHLNQFYPTAKGGNVITIRQMLNMTSGLAMTAQQPVAENQDQKVVNFAIDHMTFDEGKLGTENYQPVNYVLLAGILEKVTNKTYYQLVQEAIFKPLKLKHTGFMPTFSEEPDHTVSYRSIPNNLDSYQQPIAITPVIYNRELGTGNIYSTAGDLLKVQQAIMNGKIISKDALKTLRNTSAGVYGGGVYNYPDHIYTHGLISGYEATIYLTNDGKNGVILMSNRYLYNVTPGKAHQFITGLYQTLMTNLVQQ